MPEERTISIGRRTIGAGFPAYVVAELSANHHQDLGEAIRLIECAAHAGADAVKLQTYTPDTMTIAAGGDLFRIHGTIWEGRDLHDLYSEAFTPWEWHPKLQEVAAGLGLDFFSTPFDDTAVDFLEELRVPVYKIASFEVVDIPLLRKVATTGKPVILSTGMATLAEIDEAVSTLRTGGCRGVVLLKCVSAYPAPPSEMNLRTMAHMAATFDAPAGLSDHSPGFAVPVAAVALGACLLEKHLTLSRAVPGPDSAFSLEPDEFRAMVQAVRIAQEALGGVVYGGSASEEESRAFRRSLFVVEAVAAGEPFTARNVRSIRPAGGLHPRHLTDVLGRRAARGIERGTPLSWGLVEGGER